MAVDAEGEIFSTVRKVVEGVGEAQLFASWELGELLLKVGDGLGWEDMHTKEAEVMACAEAGDDEFLFGESGGGFFANTRNFVGVLAARL